MKSQHVKHRCNHGCTSSGWAMSRLIFVIMALAMILSGCFPTKTMFGVNEPNLAELKPGTNRSEVEKNLGERLWHVGVAEELTYDVYQFESEQPAKPISGVLILAFDFFLLGGPELGYHPRDLNPAKQVAVAYDSLDQVVFVSKPWSVEFVRGPCRRKRSLLPADSGVPATARPKVVIELAGSTPSTARMEMDFWDPWGVAIIRVDDYEYNKKSIELSPGSHKVEIYGPGETIELLSGRIYRIKNESFVGYERSHPFRFIEDVESREVLQCVPPRP